MAKKKGTKQPTDQAPADHLVHAKVGDAVINSSSGIPGKIIGTKGKSEIIIQWQAPTGKTVEHPIERGDAFWRLDLQATEAAQGEMATSTPQASDFAGEVAMAEIPIDLIDTDVQTRAIRPERIPALMESIRVGGLQQPIVVFRKWVGVTTLRYSLGPGGHRLEAFRQLGRKTIPAMVHEEADEHTIRRAQVIENFHREDNTPIEDAEQCQFMLDDVMQAHHIEDETEAVKIAAGKIGADVRWFNRRLALNRLSPRVKQLLLEEKIYIGHAEHLAELVDHAQQEEIAGRVKARRGNEYIAGKHIQSEKPPLSVEVCRQLVRHAQADLKSVPWKLDVEFSGKPACTSCIHNAANAPGLFEGAPPAKCLLPSCFTEKRKLAQSGVRRASNTLIKLGLPKSPKQAEKAMAERQVEFVKPAEVVTAAKNAMPKATSNGKASKPTKAERGGSQKQATKEKRWKEAVSKWDRDVRQWRKAAAPAVKKAITGDRKPLLALILETCFAHHLDRDPSPWNPGSYTGGEKLAAGTRAKVGKLLRHLADPTPAAFVEASQHLGLSDNVFSTSQWNKETWLLSELAKVLGVDIDPAPVFVEPKGEQPKPAAKKKPAKKKAKSKGAKAGKAGRGRA